MRLFDSLRFRIAAVFQRSQNRTQINAEMEEELRSHLQHRADDLERSGLARAEAERRARVEFGGREKYKEQCHEAIGNRWAQTLAQDVRVSLRGLKKSPGFTITAVLTLALGVGANAVVFSVLNAFILHPLNVPNAQSLYTIERGKDRSPQQSYPDYLDLRDRNHVFEGLLAFTIAPAALDGGGHPSRTWLYEASGNYFDVLRVQPYLGRFFHSADEHGPGSSPLIVLSYAYWRSQFHGDKGVVGRTVRLNKYPFTIIGVARPEFLGTELYFAPDIWAPLAEQQQVQGASDLTSRGARGMWLVGRLKSGVTHEQVHADLASLALSMARTYPKEDEGINFSLTRPGLLGDMLGKPVRAFVLGLAVLAGLILLAACANLGSLFAARTADRSKEIAVRLALGSSRKRIMRQLLTEATLVSLAGAAFGLAGGVALLHGLSAWRPVPNIPIHLPVNPDVQTYVFALVLAFVSAVLFGMVPMRQVLRTEPYRVIKSGVSEEFGLRKVSMRDLLLIVQVATCAVLVTASLVAVRGLLRSLHSRFGFAPEHTMLVVTDLGMAGYKDAEAQRMQRRMLDAVNAIPGVMAAAYADRVPLELSWNSSVVFAASATDLRFSKAAAEAMVYSISPEYFSTAGTTLMAGRSFSWHDDQETPRVAVVNREFARKLFGSAAGAIGGYFKTADGKRVQVVGVVEDGKYMTLAEEPKPAMFLPIMQSPSSGTWMLVRSDRDLNQLAAAIERSLHALDAGLPLTINSWRGELNTALFPARAASLTLGVLGTIGAVLSITGIFGMAAYSVSKRLRELGIRIALGAQRKEVLQAALGRAFKLLAVGSAAGLVLGLLASRLLAFIVYQATPRDPLVLGGVVLTMLLLGLLATWIPAQRALSIDPLILLREE